MAVTHESPTPQSLNIPHIAPKRGLFSRPAFRRNAEGWLFASPWILGFVLWTAGPMIASLVIAFTD